MIGIGNYFGEVSENIMNKKFPSSHWHVWIILVFCGLWLMVLEVFFFQGYPSHCASHRPSFGSSNPSKLPSSIMHCRAAPGRGIPCNCRCYTITWHIFSGHTMCSSIDLVIKYSSCSKTSWVFQFIDVHQSQILTTSVRIGYIDAIWSKVLFSRQAKWATADKIELQK